MFAKTMLAGMGVALGTSIGQVFTDVDGWLLSSQFLGALASLISSILLSLFSAFFLGGTAAP